MKERSMYHLISYGQTRCTYCGVVSNNFEPGNGCHACLRGVMRAINGNYNLKSKVAFYMHYSIYRTLRALGMSPIAALRAGNLIRNVLLKHSFEKVSPL